MTLADVRGDEALVCPREQAMEDAPHESFRGALSLEDGSWLWREEDAACTTGALERRGHEVPDVDLDPALIGHSLALDLGSSRDMAYVATSTALVALDPDAGQRRWWTPLVPASAQASNDVHPPTQWSGGR